MQIFSVSYNLQVVANNINQDVGIFQNFFLRQYFDIFHDRFF